MSYTGMTNLAFASFEGFYISSVNRETKAGEV